YPVLGRQLLGHVESGAGGTNGAAPAMSVDIQMILVTPAEVKTRVPVMIMFTGRGLPGLPGFTPAAGPGRSGNALPPPASGNDPPATEQLIADGWSYAALNAVSIQAGNGAGLRTSIVGFVSHGRAR